MEPVLLLQEPAVSWWHLLVDNALALTIVLIFLAAGIGAIVRLRQRDKCLRMLHDHHVTYLSRGGKVIWGDLTVYSRGIELRFDAPHRTRRGLAKTSALIYEAELADCLAIPRLDAALTEAERRERLAQVKRTFRPGLVRRAIRAVRNLINTLRDAFNQALTTLMDAFARSRPGGGALAGKQSKEIGEVLISTAGNAYDPMLERHLGKPVVLRLANPARKDDAPFELPGYLVDYTDKYLAVFNVEHAPLESFELAVEADVEREGVRVELVPGHARLTCTGPEALVVRRARIGARDHELLVALLPGCSLELSCRDGEALVLELERTHRLDLVCPREVATVTFGSQWTPDNLRLPAGLAPVEDDEPRAPAAPGDAIQPARRPSSTRT